jgi:hypothetical protein
MVAMRKEKNVGLAIRNAFDTVIMEPVAHSSDSDGGRALSNTREAENCFNAFKNWDHHIIIDIFVCDTQSMK